MVKFRIVAIVNLFISYTNLTNYISREFHMESQSARVLRHLHVVFKLKASSLVSFTLHKIPNQRVLDREDRIVG